MTPTLRSVYAGTLQHAVEAEGRCAEATVAGSCGPGFRALGLKGLGLRLRGPFAVMHFLGFIVQDLDCTRRVSCMA